ncbi:MAG TPA: hypothetical protein VK571_03635 [Gemmatimonadaceae bacterium]|nr:hypothetical protein [Gemmatimonadaceae bacterium]
MLGRSALSGGHDRAVRYIAAEAARMGLEPAGENGTYFQTFDIRERRLDSASRLVVGDAVLRPVADFKVFTFGRGNLRPIAGSQVVFGGIVGDSTTQISVSPVRANDSSPPVSGQNSPRFAHSEAMSRLGYLTIVAASGVPSAAIHTEATLTTACHHSVNA